MLNDHRIKIFSGAYGVGKTEFAVNYALRLVEKEKKVVIVDLDVVNPYFTTRSIKNFLNSKNIEVLGPTSKATYNDVPALPPEIYKIFDNPDIEAIIDLGGDIPGSKTIGMYHSHLEKSGYDLFYLINANRPYTKDLEGAIEFFEKIEFSTRLKITKIINSTHLLYDTTIDDIIKGYNLAKKLSELKKVPIEYNTIPDFLIKDEVALKELSNIEGSLFPISITLRPTWLDI